MAFTTATDTESAGPATAVAEAPAKPDEIEYPERNWIAQSISHGDAVLQAAAALRSHFRERPDVLVAMELAVYYRRDDNNVWLQPDVQVVFGVSPENRRSYRIWEEGKAPDFVLEVASPATAEHDAKYKRREYARMGVREYWRLDPEGTLMGSSLEGYEASGGKYEPVQPVASSGQERWFRSRVLGLELRSQRQARATVLVFRDPRSGEETDGAPEEAERRRRIAERDSRAAKQEASAAKQEASAAKQRETAAKQEAIAAKHEAGAANERVRALAERLRTLTARTTPSESDR
jgi:Uma2 family endonuclease